MSTDKNNEKNIDLICFGRIGVELVSEQITTDLGRSQSFYKYLGGTTANIAVGCSRMGLTSAVVSKVGNDPFGDFVMRSLTEENVITSSITSSKDYLTGMTFLSKNLDRNLSQLHYREQCADMNLTVGSGTRDIFSTAKAFLFSGICLSSHRMLTTTISYLMQAKELGLKVIFNIDYIPSLWGVTAKTDVNSTSIHSISVGKAMQKILPYCDLVIGSSSEICLLGGNESQSFALKKIKEIAKDVIVVENSDDGSCMIFDTSSITGLKIPSRLTTIDNYLGAKDAFITGFLSGYLTEEELNTCGLWGNACSALVAGRAPGSTSLPYIFEMKQFLEHGNHCEKNALLTHRANAENLPSNLFILDLETLVKQENLSTESLSELKNYIFSGVSKIKTNFPALNMGLAISHKLTPNIVLDAYKQNLFLTSPIELSEITSRDLLLTVRETVANSLIKATYRINLTGSGQTQSNQRSKLQELYNITNTFQRSLAIEVVITDLDNKNYCDQLQQVVNDIYAQEIYPLIWMIQCPSNSKQLALINEEIQKHDANARTIIVDSSAFFNEAIKFASQDLNTIGFSVGGSIIADAISAFQKNPTNATTITDNINNKLLDYCELWESMESEARL